MIKSNLELKDKINCYKEIIDYYENNNKNLFL